LPEPSDSLNTDLLLSRVCTAIDTLIECAKTHHGLFPSIIDRDTNTMIEEMPPPIAGQRNADRAHLGSNLIHDEATLRTMYGLATALDRPQYAEAADAYLQRFASHCTDTGSGLFPWGEHSFWHLVEDRVGNSYKQVPGEKRILPIHDHLRQTPVWLWEKLYAFNPACVERFARGLQYHWIDDERSEYIRHANIEVKEYLEQHARSCDFPRHGGFYILDWAFAFNQTGEPEFLSQIRTMTDYWWPKRDERCLLLIESRAPETADRFHNVNAPGQTLSLGISLLESAELLETDDAELLATMRERGLVYLEGFLNAPHDIENGIYVILCHRETGAITETMSIWGSVYGVWPVSYTALMALRAWQLTGDERILEWAKSAGCHYLREPLPVGVAIPAMDAGLALGLLADLFQVTGDSEWLEGGMTLANTLIDAYFDKELPRGAAGIDWYESQMGPGFLLHGLARLALLARDNDNCPLEGDYTAR